MAPVKAEAHWDRCDLRRPRTQNRCKRARNFSFRRRVPQSGPIFECGLDRSAVSGEHPAQRRLTPASTPGIRAGLRAPPSARATGACLRRRLLPTKVDRIRARNLHRRWWPRKKQNLRSERRRRRRADCSDPTRPRFSIRIRPAWSRKPAMVKKRPLAAWTERLLEAEADGDRCFPRSFPRRSAPSNDAPKNELQKSTPVGPITRVAFRTSRAGSASRCACRLPTPAAVDAGRIARAADEPALGARCDEVRDRRHAAISASASRESRNRKVNVGRRVRWRS